MNLIDLTNPMHRRILIEEITRGKRILKEYNEAVIWKQMSKASRETALESADDDMGPDFATEYCDENNWMNIPDTITNRIDLRPFESERGSIDNQLLANFLKEKKSSLGNVSVYKTDALDKVINFLETGRPNDYFKNEVLRGIEKAGITVNKSELMSKDDASYNSFIEYPGVNPYEQPGGRPSRGGYTGD